MNGRILDKEIQHCELVFLSIIPLPVPSRTLAPEFKLLQLKVIIPLIAFLKSEQNIVYRNGLMAELERQSQVHTFNNQAGPVSASVY